MKEFLQKFKWFLLGGVVTIGMTAGISIAAPCFVNAGCTGQANVPLGSMLTGSSTNQSLVVTSPGASSTVWTMIGSVPGWATASGGSSVSTSSIQSILFPLLANGTVAGVNATSSTVSFNIQGTGTLNPFNIASSSGTSLLQVFSNGNIGLAGIRYAFPTATGTPGQFLGNTATGTSATLAWNTPGYITVCPTGGGCNYSTDGTADQVEINQAINFLASSTAVGGTVLVKAGSYTLSGSINILSNTSLIGEGDSTVIFGTNGIGGLNLTAVSNIQVQNLRIDGTNQSSGAFNGNFSLVIINASNIKINNNSFTNTNGFGIFVDSDNNNPGGGTTKNITISNNYMSCNAHQDCIGGGPANSTGLSTTSDVSILNNIIVQNTFGGGVVNSNMDVNCFDIVQVLRINFSNNLCKGTIIFGDEQYPNTYSKIDGNIVDSPLGPVVASGEIIVLQRNNSASATQTPLSLSIINNIIKNGKITVEGTANNPIQQLFISNNQIKVSTTTAQSQDSVIQHGIYLSRVKNSFITGNVITGNGTTTIPTAAVQMQNTSFNTVSNNLINNFQYGINLDDLDSTHTNKAINNTFISVSLPVVNGSNIIATDNSGNVGIGTSTPIATLNVQGLAGTTNLFQLSSSTGTSLFIVAANGSTTISSLGAGVLCSTSGGSLYVGCSTASSGNSAWTIGINKIYNATSTDYVGIGTTSPWAKLTVQGSPTSTTSTYLFDVASSSSASYLMVTNQGNVGIGTTNPQSLLTVINNTASQIPVSGSTGQIVGVNGAPLRITFDTHNNTNTSGTALMFRRSRGTAGSPTATLVDDVLGSLNFRGYGATGYAAGSTGLMTAKAEGNFTDTSMPTTLTFDTTATGTVLGVERLRITSGGLIGIGTTGPISTLTVVGTSSLPSINPFTIASSSGASMLTLLQNGSLNLKTLATSSTALLMTNPSGQTVLQVDQTQSTAGVSIGTTSAASTFIAQASVNTDPFILASSSGTTQVIVKATGNVGIATTTPGFKLVAVGTVQFPALTTSAGTQPATICADASGQLISDTLGGGCVVSSERYKDKISNGDYGLDLFLKLHNSSYYYKQNWLTDPNVNWTGKQEGIIAEDVQKIAPELVTVEVSTSTYDNASAGTVHGLKDFDHWLGPISQSFQDLQKEINNIQVGKVKRSVEENWQWGVMGLLILYVIYNELDKKRNKRG